jgi:hypothetical protein
MRRLAFVVISLLLWAAPGFAQSNVHMLQPAEVLALPNLDMDGAPLAGVTTFQATVVLINVATSGFAFTASPDQNAIGLDGGPLLTYYQATYCLAVTPTTCPITVNLGKGIPDAANTITVTGATLLWSMLTPNVAYTATVAAVGPGGASPPSNSVGPFGVELPPQGVGVGGLILKR